MKEAFGGIVSLVLIVVFLLIVVGVLGLVVSYTKAFKMKNEIISTIEEYEGIGCITTLGYDADSACISRIKEKAANLAYNQTALNCPTGFTKVENMYCFSSERKGDYVTAKVITQVDINLPIINRIMGFSVFQVAGDTQKIYFK